MPNTLPQRQISNSVRCDYFNIPEGYPKSPLPIEEIVLNYFDNKDDTPTQVTWFGHSALLLQINGKKICGDSGYGQHFKKIGNQYRPFDLTLIECGNTMNNGHKVT